MKAKTFFTIALVSLISMSYAAKKENQKTIKGYVYETVDNNKKPLPMAYVYINNSTECTYTNADGSFDLELPKGKHEIQVTFKGYDNKTITVNIKASNKKEDLNIVLEQNNQFLAKE